MAKQQKKSEPARNTQPRLTGLDRFSVPEPPRRPQAGAAAPRGKSAGGQAGASAKSKKKSKASSGRKQQHSAAKPTQPAAKKRQASGMQLSINNGTQRLVPQKQGVSQRPLAAGRTGRARTMHLRKIIKRKQQRALLAKVFMLLLSVTCGIFSLTAFFEVKEIAVQGLTRYEQADVLATFGVREGDNLFFNRSRRGTKRVMQTYHYFERVTVERDLPSRMVLAVNEAQPIAAVNGTQGGWFVLDKNCRVLERTDQAGAAGIAEVMGIRTAGAEPGQSLKAEDAQAVENLKILAHALDEAGMGGKAHFYNLQDPQNLRFLYEDRFAVSVGKPENLERKLSMLRALVESEKFSPSDKGSIRLELGDRAITDTNLSEEQVMQTVRGQASIQHINQPETAQTGNSSTDKAEN